MENIDFVIEHNAQKKQGVADSLNIFEKTIAVSKRANDLMQDKEPALPELNRHKPTSIAVYEMVHNHLEFISSDKSLNSDDEYDDYEGSLDAEDD